MNADGSNPQRLTTDPGDDVAPGWNPAGTAIVFAAERDGNAEIYLMDANGASQRRLTTSFGMDAGYPAWSPNGERISFAAGQDGVGDLFVTDVAGNTLLQLNVEPDRLGRLDWSPDGAWIAFSSERDGNGELYAMAANGSSVVRLTDNPADDFDPHWRPTSVGPCQVRTDRWGTELRVGPGYNRGVFTDLPPNQLVTVIGQAQANDLSLWWSWTDPDPQAPERAEPGWPRMTWKKSRLWRRAAGRRAADRRPRRRPSRRPSSSRNLRRQPFRSRSPRRSPPSGGQPGRAVGGACGSFAIHADGSRRVRALSGRGMLMIRRRAGMSQRDRLQVRDGFRRALGRGYGRDPDAAQLRQRRLHGGHQREHPRDWTGPVLGQRVQRNVRRGCGGCPLDVLQYQCDREQGLFRHRVFQDVLISSGQQRGG